MLLGESIGLGLDLGDLVGERDQVGVIENGVLTLAASGSGLFIYLARGQSPKVVGAHGDLLLAAWKLLAPSLLVGGSGKGQAAWVAVTGSSGG